ncbi:MAG: germination lipoprotein GerS-related protein [Sarcina sp.]
MKNKILISIVVLILVVVGSLAFYTSYKQNTNPDKIVKDIIMAKEYEVEVEYTTKNSRGEFTQKAKIFHANDETKLVLEDKEQIFSKDKIKINYFEGDKHFTVDRSYDEFYRFFLLNELPKYLNGKGVKYNQNEDIMAIDFKTDSLNNHFSTAKLTINLREKEPEALVIFDNAGKEKVTVKYSGFISK